MSALKPYARRCLTRCVHVQLVMPHDVMARPALVSTLDLRTCSAEDAGHIQVCYMLFPLSSLFSGFLVFFFRFFFFTCSGIIFEDPKVGEFGQPVVFRLLESLDCFLFVQPVSLSP